jgi:lipopolysaccharide/colanic/teichoic acid biosynthesis glycosyltransferase
VGVQPLPIDTSGFELRSVRRQSFLWLQIAIAERLLATALLVLVFPLLVLAGTIIAVLSRRSPLIAHPRVGQDGRFIWVLKLRTMWDSNPPSFRFNTLVERLQPECFSPVHIKTRDDPRVTSRFATLCRRYSIDELPQLWHVLRGDLALVGPRPLTADELEAYYAGTIEELLSMKPGLSGLWQIRGRSRLSYRERRRFDLFMIRKWSPSLYFRILMATLPTVLSGKNAW